MGSTSGDRNLYIYGQLIADAEGLDKIKSLGIRHDGNNEICGKAAKLLRRYWAQDESLTSSAAVVVSSRLEVGIYGACMHELFFKNIVLIYLNWVGFLNSRP